MKRLALVSAASCALLLTACATTSAPTAEDAGLRPAQSKVDTEGQSGYGQFLAGQKAQADGQDDEAASYFARAQALGAETGTLKQRIFQSALFSGDVTRAAAAAPVEGEASVMVVRLDQLTRTVEALATDDAATAKAIMLDTGVGFPHRQAAVLLTPWPPPRPARKRRP